MASPVIQKHDQKHFVCIGWCLVQSIQHSAKWSALLFCTNAAPAVCSLMSIWVESQSADLLEDPLMNLQMKACAQYMNMHLLCVYDKEDLRCCALCFTVCTWGFFQYQEALIICHSQHFDARIHDFSHRCFLWSSEVNYPLWSCNTWHIRCNINGLIVFILDVGATTILFSHSHWFVVFIASQSDHIYI